MTTAPVRPAASVFLVRAAPSGSWETYLLRRSESSPVLAGQWVFPGGTLRTDDRSSMPERLSPTFPPKAAHAALTRPPGSPASSALESWAYFVAAARELLEEAGVLLGGPKSASSRRSLDAARRSLEQGSPMGQVAAERGFTLDLRQLTYYAHWITPEAVPQRFDARFFMARLPEGQKPSPSGFEMSEGIWLNPLAALERNSRGDLPMHFVTLSHLRRLAANETLDDLLAFAAAKPVVPVMPKTRQSERGVAPFLAPEQGEW